MIGDLAREETREPTPPATGAPPRALDRWLDLPERRRGAILHWISLVVAFPLLLWIDRHQWFSGDEWDLLVRRGVVGDHELGLLQPHNEHWVTAPLLVYRALFSVFGVRTYVPYLVVLILAHLVVAHLLWRLMLRCGVQWLVAVAASTVFMVLGAGWENLVNAFQITFVVPLALGLGALLLVPERGPFQRRDAWASLLLVLALPFSGVSLTMVLVVGLTTFLRRGWKPALLTVVAPAVVYLGWYAGWGRHVTAVEQEPVSVALQSAPAFVWHGLVSAVDQATGLVGIGPVVLVLLAAWIVRRLLPAREPWPLVLPLFLGAPIFLFLVDIRRSGLGTDAAGAPRYSYLVLALMAPAAALAATALIARTPARTVIVVGVTAVLCLVGVSLLNDQAQGLVAVKQENRARIVAAADLLRSGAPLLTDAPAPELDPDLRTPTLRTLARIAALPDVRVTAEDRLNAATFLQTLVGPGAQIPLVRSGAASAVGLENARATPDGACLVLTPTGDAPAILLAFDQPGSVEVTPSRSESLGVQLQAEGSGPVVRSAGRSWPVVGGAPVDVSSSATNRVLRLQVPAAGTTRVCGLQPGGVGAS